MKFKNLDVSIYYYFGASIFFLCVSILIFIGIIPTIFSNLIIIDPLMKISLGMVFLIMGVGALLVDAILYSSLIK